MACCQQLEIRAASIDGKPVSGEYLIKKPNKIAYRFNSAGKEVIIDIQRGSHLHRLTFISGNSTLKIQPLG